MESVHTERHAGSILSDPKVCPWCLGKLTFKPEYARDKLLPADWTLPAADGVPEWLRLVPAWVCSTPSCKFRMPA
jgi:hypothetical protein